MGGRGVRALRGDPGNPADPDAWPATVPAVAQILASGPELAAGLTVLIGENGSGKSTVVETLAEACGLNPQGGSALGGYRTAAGEPGLGSRFIVERSPVRPHWSYFLRADTMHGLYTYLAEAVPGASILELGDWGIRPASWTDLDLVGHWHRFLNEPESYFRHLLSD